MLFDEIDKDLSTKDKQVITDKLEMLEELMMEYLKIENSDFSINGIETFIANNLNMDTGIVLKDMDLYNDSLDALLEKAVKVDSQLRNRENRPSLLAMIVYSYKDDKDLDDWMITYARDNNTYFIDQTKNFLHMKKYFEIYYRKNLITSKLR